MDPNFPDVVLRTGGGRRCRVVYSYTPQNEDELELAEKDEIEFLSEVEEGWWRGRLKGRVGVFPSNFVVELPAASGPVSDEPSLSEGEVSAPLSSPEEVPVLPPKPVREQCRVLFPYEAAIEDELTLHKDDIVTIITKDVEDKGWWKGELRGKIGLFPDNFVQLITTPGGVSDENKKPDRPAKNLPAEPKVDSKIPLMSIGTKRNEIEATKNSENETAVKRQSADLSLIKPDTVAAHRKSLEEKALIKPDTVAAHKKTIEEKAVSVASHKKTLEEKKPPVLPYVTGKPKPIASAKPSNVKRLSAGINDLVDGAASSKPSSQVNSRVAVEDLDLDAVGRSDMLSHITASRPRAPGRRPPTSTSNNKENEENSLVTNGTSEGVKAERSPKERQKQVLPFMDELKVNLKSSKSVVETNSQVKTAFGMWGSQVNSHVETSSDSNHVKSVTSSDVRHSLSTSSDVKHSVSTGAEVKHSSTTQSSKVSELSSVFDVPSGKAVSPSHDFSQKQILDLKTKVDKLERIVSELAAQLREEADKRRQIEKELVKLTDLVTQV